MCLCLLFHIVAKYDIIYVKYSTSRYSIEMCTLIYKVHRWALIGCQSSLSWDILRLKVEIMNDPMCQGVGISQFCVQVALN